MSSWELDDAEQRHAESPRSFFIPPPELRRSLAPGAVVKLIHETRFAGTLLNQPMKLEGLKEGEVVSFEPRHAAAYDYSDEELGYRPGDAGYLPGRMRAKDPRPHDSTLGYLTDLWPELAGPFRDAREGEEWIWDADAGAYRREG